MDDKEIRGIIVAAAVTAAMEIVGSPDLDVRPSRLSPVRLSRTAILAQDRVEQIIAVHMESLARILRQKGK